MNNATVRMCSPTGRNEGTRTGLRILCGACLCGTFLLGWGLSSAETTSSPERASLAQAAERAMKDMDEDAVKAKTEKFDYLMGRAKESLKRGEYAHALVAVEKAMKLYPDDASARYLKNKIMFDSDKSRDELLSSAMESGFEEAIDNIDVERIIPSQVVTYPEAEDWAKVLRRSRRPGRGVKGPIVAEWEKTLRKKLEQRISFSFDNASLGEIAKYLQDCTGVGVVIDPRASIAKAPITLPAEDISLGSALNLICRFAEAKWSMADTMIYISESEVTDEPELGVYDVSDLVIPVRDFRTGGRQPLVANTATSNNRGANGLQVIVEYPDQGAHAPEQEQSGRGLARFIMNTVAPETWAREDETGAGANTVQYRNGRLIVSNRPGVHGQIVKLLESFRKARTVQIMVLVRFIDIEKNYLEEIGVDWTGLEGGVNTISPQAQHTPIDADTGNAIPIPRGFSARGASALDEFGNPWSTGYRFVDADEDYQGLPDGYDAVYGEIPDGWKRNPEPGQYWQDINKDGEVQANELFDAKRLGGPWDVGMANINQLGINLGDQASDFTSEGGLIMDLAYLSRWQVRILLEAVVKHRKGNVLTSPRLTCFNGERANIAVTTEVSYLRNIQEGVPDIGFITDGIVFEVVPYASADRHYITMELLPTLRKLRWPIRTMLIEIPEERDDGGVVWTRTNLQLPEIAVKSIETFASVPDGGTLLLGGLTRAREGEARAGIPIIDDIPILKFFFSRWGKTDTRSSLIVLVKAEVIIQGEKEPNVGPPG